MALVRRTFRIRATFSLPSDQSMFLSVFVVSFKIRFDQTQMGVLGHGAGSNKPSDSLMSHVWGNRIRVILF